jgi:hypothetical protein
VESPTARDGFVDTDALRRAAGIDRNRQLILQLPDGSNRTLIREPGCGSRGISSLQTPPITNAVPRFPREPELNGRRNEAHHDTVWPGVQWMFCSFRFSFSPGELSWRNIV